MKKKFRTAAIICFTIYALVMLWLLFGQRLGQSTDAPYLSQLKEHCNLIPFETISLFFRLAKNSTSHYWIGHAVVNLLGNVVMFVPLGLLPCIFPRLRKFGWFSGTVVLIILAVEVLQLFTLLGSMDIDDFLLNTLGATLGFIIFSFANKHIVM